MAELNADEMAELERLLAPGSNIPDDVRTQALTRRAELQDKHLSGTMPKPGEEGASPEERLQLSPNFSLIPQALAVQPATTHRVSDDSERAAWRADPEGAAKGKVIVYDVPLAIVKKDLLEHPEKVRALYPDLLEKNPGAVTPESIMALDHSSSLYKDYQELTWRDTANAAAANGKTAIRYAKAPWLHTQGGLLNNLELKLEGAVQPYGEATSAFLMGVDDATQFGAGRAASEVAGEAGLKMEPANPLGTERYGGVTETNPVERNAQLEEEYPGMHLGGEAVGMLSGWGLANYLFGKALGVGRKAANLAGDGAKGVLARLGAGTAAGTVGAAGIQLGRDAVDVVADEARQAINPEAQPVGPSPDELASRAERAGRYALPLALGGAALGDLASRGAENVRWGNRYDGAPGQLEQQLGKDIEFRVGRGPVSPPIEELKVKARQADRPAGDMLTKEVAPPIAKVLDQDVKSTFEQVATKRDAFIRSPEGKAPIPVKNFLEENAKELRADFKAQREGGVPEAVGKAGSGKELRDFFNQQIDDVSVKPQTGAIALTPEEAQAFLTPENIQKALRSRGSVKAPKLPNAPSPDVPPALSPPEELPRSASAAPKNTPEPRVQIPDDVPGVPPRPAPPGIGSPSYGAASALPGRSRPAPEPRQEPRPEPKASVRVTSPRARSFATDMRSRGISKVYVVPKSYDAEGLESLLDKIGAEGQKAGSRDLTKLDKAARRDRDLRPMDGKAGGWSALQNQHSELIEKAKLAEELVGDNAFQVIVNYGRPQAGEALRADVIEEAAERAGVGVRDQVKRIRALEKYEDLRKQSSMEGSTRYPNRRTAQSALDFASIRSYPIFRALDPLGGVGPYAGPNAAKAAGVGTGESDEARRNQRLREDLNQ